MDPLTRTYLDLSVVISSFKRRLRRTLQNVMPFKYIRVERRGLDQRNWLLLETNQLLAETSQGLVGHALWWNEACDEMGGGSRSSLRIFGSQKGGRNVGGMDGMKQTPDALAARMARTPSDEEKIQIFFECSKLSSIDRSSRPAGPHLKSSFEFTRAMATPSVDFLVTKDPEANSKGVPSAIFIVRIRIYFAESTAEMRNS